MKRTILLLLRAAGLMAVLVLLFQNQLFAQAPTSLEYPGVSVYRTQVDNVFLAPTVSGNISSYSITPALTAGLSMDVNTGIITGVATAEFGPITYTVTATNGAGSTTATLTLSAIDYYYNNANGVVSFLAANTVPKVYSTLATAGQTQGDIVLFTTVATIGGQAIDCIVKTTTVANVTSWNAYDQQATAGMNYNSNSDNYFSPQISFGAGGGSLRFDFQFILGGSYDNLTNTGIDIVMQNVKLNTYDIDGNGTAIQFNEFGGFNTSELGTTTNQVVSFNTATGLTRYTSNTATNTPTITDPINRVRVSYNEMSDFSIVAGADDAGLAFFFLDFSIGGGFTTNATPAPSIDLNKTKTGVNNAGNACDVPFNFTDGITQTNAASTTNLTDFTIRFATSSIVNGANEKLLINGATSGGSIALNFANGAVIADVVMGTVITYDVTATVAAGTSTLTFVRSAGTSAFVLARAEELADALQYQNLALPPTNATRKFKINMRNTLFRSPDAIYTAKVNCVSISGNIYHDANALTDNLVNANSTSGQFANGTMYGILANSVNNQVLKQSAISGSAYSFGTAVPGKYRIYFSNNTPPAIGSTFAASTFPAATYYSTGEHMGASAGSDLLTDGRLTVTVGSTSVINANFGLQLPPTATGVDQATALNPGGFNFRTVPGSAFGTADTDGTVTSITITSFPTNTNYLKVGTTVYINGGTCPPQSTCTTWPGTLTIACSGGVPASTISVDPIDGNTTVTINYISKDNGNASSIASSIDIPFNVPATPLSISGTVWNDANGDGQINGAETGTNAAASGQLLYAVLVQTNNTYSTLPTILASDVTDAAGAYSFPDVPSGNNYTVRILSRATAPRDGDAETTLTASLATNYTGVSTNNSGTITTGQNTNNLVNTINAFTASKVNVNFGIERLSTANSASHTIAVPAYNSVKALIPANGLTVLAGSDPEDGAKGVGSAIKIISVAGMNGNVLKYNGTTLAANSTFSGYVANNLAITFTGTGSSSASFTFVFLDNAGLPGLTPATYSITFAGVLPVNITSFEAVRAEKNAVMLTWETANEQSIAQYNIQHSANGADWTTVGTTSANGSSRYTSYVYSPIAGMNYYRLQIVSQGGTINYSGIRKVNIGEEPNSISAHPNPVTDKLTVFATGNMATGVASILDSKGRVVLQANILNGKVVIDMQQLAAGVYILRATGSDNSVSTKKIIKN